MTPELGDFQTNISLARRICKVLKGLNVNPDLIIEPTCGEGNFINASLENFPSAKKIVGIELQKHYVNQAKENFPKNLDDKTPKNVEVINGNIFDYKFNNLVNADFKEVLLIGNPPWATNSALQGKNLPKKSNFKRYNGLDAITGKANFDISEYILLHLLREFKDVKGTLAFLCKTQVAKNLMQFLPNTDFTASNFKIFLIDASEEFNVSVEACLFVCRLGDIPRNYLCKVFDLDNPQRELRTFGWYKNKFVADIEKYKKTLDLDGVSQIVWRSGIKHDCSKIMELNTENTHLKNKLGEVLRIETDLIYPLIKSSDTRKHYATKSKRRMIVTQKRTGEDTNYIAEKYPNLWSYLNSHNKHFNARKSSIYRKNARFAIFGVGDYSFKKYKIAISGLYKEPNFCLLFPERNKTMMVDDSCYFLGFDNIKFALITLAVLNSNDVKSFLQSITFSDAKRPYTKDNLMRIDILKALGNLDYNQINNSLAENNINYYKISEYDLTNFKEFLSSVNYTKVLPRHFKEKYYEAAARTNI